MDLSFYYTFTLRHQWVRQIVCQYVDVLGTWQSAVETYNSKDGIYPYKYPLMPINKFYH